MTRNEALPCLIGKWIDACQCNPGTSYRLPLTRILTEDNLQAVIALDLYPEHGGDRRGISNCSMLGCGHGTAPLSDR